MRCHRKWWLTEKEYVQQQGYDAPETLAMICEFVDVMYAQHLQTPAQWSVGAWREFGNWPRQYSLQDRRGIRQGNVFAKLALVLGDANVMTSKHAHRLAEAMQGKQIIEDEMPSRVKGKDMSKNSCVN